MLFGNFEVLANGHIIVPHYNLHRVVEYDDKGAAVGQAITPPQGQQWPNSVARLSNGHTLISSQHPQTNKKIAEYDANRTLVSNGCRKGTMRDVRWKCACCEQLRSFGWTRPD